MTNNRIIDDIDRELLTMLQQNARMSNTDMARKVGLAPSAVLERVRKLEERKLIHGYAARVDPRSVGRGLLAFVSVRTDGREITSQTARRLAEIPEVQEVHNVAGDDCYLVKVRVADTEALGQLLREKVSSLPNVGSTRTTIVLETLKETIAVPIAMNGRNGAGRKRPRGGKR